MDAYTRRTRDWLDERFRLTDDDGVYLAHQPIYGFRVGHSEPGLISRYVRTHAILDALSRLRAESLLDVGAAEGYKAALACELLGMPAAACDLSTEACRRCADLFQLKAAAADVHRLPFADDAFDVALCSETLEHVTDFDAAVGELLRVSRKAVIITVPHESTARTRRNRRKGGDHSHIHHFDLRTFDRFAVDGRRVVTRPIVSPLVRSIGSFGVGMRKTRADSRPLRAAAQRIQNALAPLGRMAFDLRRLARLIEFDRSACRMTPGYRAIVSVILEDPAAWTDQPRVPVTAEQILRYAVPLKYLG